MKFHLVSLICISLFVGCKPSKNTEKLQSEIDKLTNPELQSKYLEEIYFLDQKIRKVGQEITRDFGYDSQEQKEHDKEFRRIDKENLHKVKLYLDTYGHPKKDTHTEKACGTPWLVLHHAPSAGDRREYHKYLYQAWKDGDITGSTYAFFLNRFYNIEKGGFIDWNRPFTEADEIDSIHTALGLLDGLE